MKKLVYLACLTCIVSFFATGCRPTAPTPVDVNVDSDSVAVLPE